MPVVAEPDVELDERADDHEPDALLIPVSGPIEEVSLDGGLDQLQGIVGGSIEAVPLPPNIPDSEYATAYINEEGKFNPDCKPNMRATDFMIPGIGIFFNDYIAGAFLLCGFDPLTGEHQSLPRPVIERARLIEREAG